MIFPVWQEIGQSSHKLAQACGQLLGQKTTHTGTLDPMAEGVLVVLTDDDRFVKGELQDWRKTYRFSILWGVATDSGDRLGIINKVQHDAFDPSSLETTTKEFPLQYDQVIPDFSARRWQGHSAFDWAKENTLSPPPEKKRLVSLEQFSLLSSEDCSLLQVLAAHHQAVSLVAGDFRQPTVLKSWQESLTAHHSFFISHHQVATSAGTYIRQLVQDVARKLDVPATTWAITRTVNGPFEKQDCIEISELTEL